MSLKGSADRVIMVECIVPLLASVQDERMREIMDTWCPETVYHAAAWACAARRA